MFPRSRVRLGLVAAAAAVLGGCAPAGPVASTPPAPAGARVSASARLLQMEDRRAWDRGLLDSLLRSGDPELRRRAALAAGRVRGEGAVNLLAPLLRDSDTTVAATAAFALGQVGDTVAVPLLASLLRADAARQSPTVVGEAAAALGKLGTPAAVAATSRLLAELPLEGAPAEAAGPALLAVAKLPAFPPETLRWMGSPDPKLRWRAAYSLARRGEPAAVAPLLRLLHDGDRRVRAAAVRGLRAPRADSAGVSRGVVLAAVRPLLGDADAAVRVNATRALGSFSSPEAATALTEVLAGGDTVLAIAAAEALGRIGPVARAAAPELLRLAADVALPTQLRAAALLALGEAAPSAALPVAEQLSRSPSWRLRSAAALAAVALGAPGAAVLERTARDGDPRVVAATLSAAADAADHSLVSTSALLFAGLVHPDVMVRTAALRGAAHSSDPARLAALLDGYARAQQDTLNDAALAAVEGLAAVRESGIPTAAPFFARFRRSPDPIVRHAVEELFGDTARAAWGEALPLDTKRDTQQYAELLARASTPSGRAPRVRIETTRGDFDVELAAREAPLTTESFLRLAERGFFDGQEWPRVVPNFVIQGGDPRGDTSGGPGYAIRDELNRLRYERGSVGMALAGPDTGGSQFFVTHSAQPHLDGSYTVFGRVVRGMDVVDRILAGDRILRVHRLP